jgi:hypothetical protein
VIGSRSGSPAKIGKDSVVPACTILFPIGVNTGGLFGAGDGLAVGAADGLVLGSGDEPLGEFGTMNVIVSELSVVVTATLTWLPVTVAVLETVPLNGHMVCAQNRAPKMLGVRIGQIRPNRVLLINMCPLC